MAVSPAVAQTTTSTFAFADFDGTLNTSGFPVTFNWFSLGNAAIHLFSATLSGTFGNATVANSAGVDLFFGNILVAQCVQNAACWTSQTPTAWSYTLTAADLASLNTWIISNTLNGTAVQTSPYVVRLGVTTVRMTYGPPNVTPVPEPATVGLMALGLVGVGAAGYRRRKQAK